MTRAVTKEKVTPKRLQTQQRIIEALEQVIVEQGIENVGVNAVVEQAGVGKGLIYKYFGGLTGLLEAWADNPRFSPAPEDVVGEPLEEFGRRSATERLAKVHVSYANMIRDSAVLTELMAEELLKPTVLSGPIKQVRDHIGQTHENFFTQDDTYNNQDDMALIFVLQAASNYLALRANSSPNFNGVMLDSDEGWEAVMAMIELVAGMRDR